MAIEAKLDECATLPPVVTGIYEPKGKYIKLGALEKCCQCHTPLFLLFQLAPPPNTIFNHSIDVTGPSSSNRAILFIYDAFGYAPQTLQAADLLSAALSALVLMPDYFKGNPASPDWFPADTPEKQRLRDEFMRGPASMEENIPAVKRSVEDARRMYEAVGGRWGVWGLCWGGKARISRFTSLSFCQAMDETY